VTAADYVIVILMLCGTLSTSEGLQTGTGERVIAVAAVAWVQLLGKGRESLLQLLPDALPDLLL